MRMPTRLPLGAVLSAISAAICAVPTLVLPADSPNAPKVALLAVATVVFIVGVARVRSEEGPLPHAGQAADRTEDPIGDPRHG